MDKERIPSPHLAGKFKVIGVLPGEVHFKKETVDLRTITAEKAEEIFKAGFPYLQREIGQSKIIADKKELGKAGNAAEHKE
jgi:hypothetical protein